MFHFKKSNLLNSFLALFAFGLPILCYSQSYDSIAQIQFEAEILNLEMDDSKAKIYISEKEKAWVFDINKGKLKELKISAKHLPEAQYVSKVGEKEVSFSHPSPYQRAKFSKNGDYLVFYFCEHQHQKVFVYKKRFNRSYKLHVVFDHEKNINSVAISEDLILATGSGYGIIKLWDLKKKKFIRTMEAKISQGYVKIMKFSSHDPSKMIIGNGSSQCIVLDSKTDQIYQTWQIKWLQVPNSESRVGQGVNEVFFTFKDSLALISLNSQLHTSLNIWTIGANSHYQFPLDIIQPKSFGTFNSQLVIANSNGEFIFYDLSKRKISHRFNSHQNEIEKLKVSSSGKYLACFSKDGKLKVWAEVNSIAP